MFEIVGEPRFEKPIAIRQAIVCTYFGPTNKRPARVRACADAGKVFVHWNSSLSTEENYFLAAMHLMRKFHWDRYCKLIAGSMPESSGLVFVQVEKEQSGH